LPWVFLAQESANGNDLKKQSPWARKLALFSATSNNTKMKKHPFIICTVLVSLFAAFQVFGEEEKTDAGPSEAIIRKLGAMMPDQKFKREEATVSDGKIAPKDATIYPVQLMNADESPLFKAFFFKEGDLWAIFDEAGQVMRETK
jgi:hypothetical protein